MQHDELSNVDLHTGKPGKIFSFFSQGTCQETPTMLRQDTYHVEATLEQPGLD